MIAFSLVELPEQTGVRVGESAAAGPRYGHGCIPGEPDPRDYPDPFEDDPNDETGAAKTHVDLSTAEEMPEVWDQELGIESCVAHAVAAAWVFAARRSGNPAVTPSRLFIWYEARVKQYETTHVGNQAVGIREALNVLYTSGAPPEELWPYDMQQLAVRPPDSVYTEAQRHKATNYFILNPPGKNTNLEKRLKALLAVGLPICFAFQYFPVLESDEVARTGEVPMPQSPPDHSPGAHAALLVGYDDETRRFKVRNSYGSSWGQQGYFTMPYEYVCSPWAGPRFWTLRLAF